MQMPCLKVLDVYNDPCMKIEEMHRTYYEKSMYCAKKGVTLFPQEIITVNKKSSRLAGLGCLFRKQKSCKTHWHMPCFRFIIGSSKCFLWTFARTFSNSSFGSSCDQLPTMNHATAAQLSAPVLQTSPRQTDDHHEVSTNNQQLTISNVVQ